MNTINQDLDRLNMIPLNDFEIRNIHGGDKLSEDLFRAAGYVWQSVKNAFNAYVEASKKARLANPLQD